MTRPNHLSEDEAGAVVAALRAASPALAQTLSPDRPTTVRRLDDLDAYPGVEFFAVTVTISHRPVTHRCARTRDALVRVEGPDSVAALNRLVGLRLEAAESVVDYVRAWFRLAGSSTEWLAESSDQFSWTSAVRDDPASAAIAEQAASLVHPPRVTATDSGRFRVVVTVMRQQTLASRILDVAPDGAVRDVSSNDLLTGVPVPFVAR